MGICAILEWQFPSIISIDRDTSINLGKTLFILAWIIIFTAKYQFKKHGQKSGPGKETTGIIKSGLFCLTRNPIYLGVILILPAIGLIINSLWFVLAIIPCFILMQRILILPEEKYLLDKFGSEYSDYCKKVRRWL